MCSDMSRCSNEHVYSQSGSETLLRRKLSWRVSARVLMSRWSLTTTHCHCLVDHYHRRAGDLTRPSLSPSAARLSPYLSLSRVLYLADSFCC
ncbi:hypothetical protein J6590_030584 [Homalodisca vitripennis]|nr:hypothetical protein J6590_030584 [Homalodisca vitripennis]